MSLFVGLSIIAIVIVIFKFAPKSLPEPQSAPTSSPKPQSKFDSLNSSSKNIEFSLNAKSVTIPKTLPVYQLELPPNTPNESILNLVKKIGLEGDPEKINTNAYSIFSWEKGGESITYDATRQGISYSSPTTASVSLPNKDSASDLVKTYIDQAYPIKSPITISFLNAQFYTNQGSNSRPTNNPKVGDSLQINYQFIIEQYPLYLHTLNASSISAKVISDGKITSFTMRLPPTISETVDKITLSPAAIKTSIANNEGHFINAVTEVYSEMNPTIDMNEATITKMALVYILDSGRNELIPMLELSGDATNLQNQRINFRYIVDVIDPSFN